MSAALPPFLQAQPLVVALAGSRYGSPLPVAPVVSLLVGSGAALVVGCAPGVDQAVRACAPGASVISAQRWHYLPRAAALAARTSAVVSSASVLLIWPGLSGARRLGRGSSLALSLAVRRRLPVWVAGLSAPPVPGVGWSPCAVAGVAGWLWSPAAQLTLFN